MRITVPLAAMSSYARNAGVPNYKFFIVRQFTQKSNNWICQYSSIRALFWASLLPRHFLPWVWVWEPETMPVTCFCVSVGDELSCVDLYTSEAARKLRTTESEPGHSSSYVEMFLRCVLIIHTSLWDFSSPWLAC